MPDYPEWFLDLCRSVTAKRPKTVIDHILEHGHITTEELKDEYGYDHPPRAARDVRELGFPWRLSRLKHPTAGRLEHTGSAACLNFASSESTAERRFPKI